MTISCSLLLLKARLRASSLSRAPSGLDGFTLPELLVALVIASVTLASAGAVMLSHIRSVSGLEQAQRQRDNAGRLDYLVQIEASEPGTVLRDIPVSQGCKAGTAVFAFEVPRNKGAYQQDGNSSFIYYYNDGNDVRRCGPPVLRDGVLDHSENAPMRDGVAVRDAKIEQVTCDGESTDDGQAVYKLVYSSGFQPSCSIARARTVLVCNLGPDGKRSCGDN